LREEQPFTAKHLLAVRKVGTFDSNNSFTRVNTMFDEAK
jgi:hypothetical protein